MSKEVSSNNQVFYTGTGEQLLFLEVVKRISAYIALHPTARYEVVVGSDSHASLSGHAAFVTALVVRKIGNGGIHFWTRKDESFFNLHDRIWKETLLSITCAQELKSLIKEVMGEEVLWARQLEFRYIHLDVGYDGPTRDLIDGVCGMVKGFGFEPVIKPYSYGAFAVADRHT